MFNLLLFLKMDKAKFNVFSVLMGLFLLTLISCVNPGKSSRDLTAIQTELDELQRKLPIHIPNTPLVMKSVVLEDDIVTYTVELTSSFEEFFSMTEKDANSDRNIARMINSVGKRAVTQLIDNELGLRYIYLDNETGDTLLTISVDAERMAQIKKQLDEGSIEPYTTKELLQMEIDQYDFPCDIGDGVWLTDGYIRGNNVYYEATLESDITSDDLTYSDLQEMKRDCISGIEETLVRFQKQGFYKENIHLIYIYKNNNGEEFARIDLSPDDLFGN